MSKISPCLWFDGQAEEAAALYTSLFPNSRIERVNRSPGETPSGPEGWCSPSTSPSMASRSSRSTGVRTSSSTRPSHSGIDCEDQEEVDRYWDALIADGGEPSVCGWLKDRFGVSWQVVPKVLPQMLSSSDGPAAKRALEAMLQMTKLDVAKLREAYEGVPA
jgi:predicted 3-demethylubiquinone-9 3-methyltransferase (glyoxalase superfamily)